MRHSSEFLTSWASGGVIFLNHSKDNTTNAHKTQTLKHEYGHILQEQRLGRAGYIAHVFIPSVTTNVIARFDSVISKNYYNMPWEYDADIRGGAKREHAWWAKYLHGLYFPFWEK